MHRHLLAASFAALLAAGCGSSQTAEGHTPGCDSCHAFPPATATAGNVIASHATAPGGTWEATDCSACHPTSVNTAGETVPTAAGGTHLNGVVEAAGHGMPYPPAEHGPDADRGLATCQGCHGSALNGAGGTPSCNACHAAPVVDGGAAIPNWQTNCTFCHGTRNAAYTAADLPTAAPPEDVAGATAATDVTVGVHRRHVEPGANGPQFASPRTCSDCHNATTPTSATDAGHLGAPPAEVPFGTVARSRGRAPTWNRTSATCSNTWCHSQGGAVPNPNWTVVGALGCGDCHLASNLTDPVHTRISATAVAKPACSACHGVGVPVTATHVNGIVEIPGVTCVSCHGNTAGSATAASPRQAAPPVDAHGNATGAKVGAHADHLDGATYSNGFACTTCHPAVGSYTLLHADGAADVSLTTPASPAGSYAGGTCTNTYCHGTFPGGTGADPSWTGTITCTSCHSPNTPTTGRHDKHVNGEAIACNTCHAGYTSSTVNKANHVNGVKNVAAGWNGTACSNGCHGTSEGNWY